VRSARVCVAYAQYYDRIGVEEQVCACLVQVCVVGVWLGACAQRCDMCARRRCPRGV